VVTIGMALTESITGFTALAPYVAALGVHCALLTLLSGIQYIAFGVRALGAQPSRSAAS
jgi:hypothetical protein